MVVVFTLGWPEGRRANRSLDERPATSAPRGVSPGANTDIGRGVCEDGCNARSQKAVPLRERRRDQVIPRRADDRHNARAHRQAAPAEPAGHSPGDEVDGRSAGVAKPKAEQHRGRMVCQEIGTPHNPNAFPKTIAPICFHPETGCSPGAEIQRRGAKFARVK